MPLRIRHAGAEGRGRRLLGSGVCAKSPVGQTNGIGQRGAILGGEDVCIVPGFTWRGRRAIHVGRPPEVALYPTPLLEYGPHFGHYIALAAGSAVTDDHLRIVRVRA